MKAHDVVYVPANLTVAPGAPAGCKLAFALQVVEAYGSLRLRNVWTSLSARPAVYGRAGSRDHLPRVAPERYTYLPQYRAEAQEALLHDKSRGMESAC
jgi:hypothetical protein